MFCIHEYCTLLCQVDDKEKQINTKPFMYQPQPLHINKTQTEALQGQVSLAESKSKCLEPFGNSKL